MYRYPNRGIVAVLDFTVEKIYTKVYIFLSINPSSRILNCKIQKLNTYLKSDQIAYM